MSMMKCPECESDISSKAVFCPHCGYPMEEKAAITEYELEKGQPEESGLASLLSVLAWLTWIGGLIIAIAGANVTQISYYSEKTEFSLATFLTLLVPFVIYGAILMGMSTMARQIAETYGMVNGLKLIRRTVKQNLVDRDIKQGGILSEKSNCKAASVQNDSGFVVCPKCGMSIGKSLLHQKKICVGCGYPFENIDDEINESDQVNSDSVREEDPFGWVNDEKPGFVRCPKCDFRASFDYMKYRKACPKCGCAHIRQEE